MRVASRDFPSPSPFLSVNWKAWTRRSVSSTERPTGRSLMVICLRMPLSSITNRPLADRRPGYDAAGSSTAAMATLANAASPVRDSVIFLQYAVVSGDLLGEIGHEGDLHFTQTALFSWRVNPVKNKYNF